MSTPITYTVEPVQSAKRALNKSANTPAICALEPAKSASIPPSTPVNTTRQAKRHVVIIDSKIYPLESLNYPEMDRSIPTRGGGKLRKKALVRREAGMLKPGRVAPVMLPPNYLDVEDASRKATLHRVLTLSKSRSCAKNGLKQGNLVSTAPGAGVVTVDSQGGFLPAVEPADHVQKESAPQQRLRCKRTHGVQFRDSSETRSEKCDRLGKERDRYARKCESLEWVLDNIYGKVMRLDGEPVSPTRMQEELENEAIRFRKRIGILEAEATAEHAKLDDEISKRRLRGSNVFSTTDGNQRMKSFKETSNAKLQQSQSSRHLVSNSSPSDAVSNDGRSRTKSFSRTLYDSSNLLCAAERKCQIPMEASHKMPYDMQVRGRPTINSLVDRCCLDGAMSHGTLEDGLMIVEALLDQPQPEPQICIRSPELGATTASEASQKHTDLRRSDLVASQLSELLQTSNRSNSPKESDAVSVTLQNLNHIAPNAAYVDLRRPNSPSMSNYLPELDSATSSEDENSNKCRSSIYTISLLGSPRIQAVPAVHRVRISNEETEQAYDEASAIANMNTWEWCSVPELKLWDAHSGMHTQW